MGEFGGRSSYEQTGNLQLDFYHGSNTANKNNWIDRRSYSLDSNNNQSQFHQNNNVFDPQFRQNKLQKSKTMSSSKIWCFSDPEFKRKKRVASYRAFTVEGKVKGSFKRSFTWLKDKIIHGLW